MIEFMAKQVKLSLKITNVLQPRSWQLSDSD